MNASRTPPLIGIPLYVQSSDADGSRYLAGKEAYLRILHEVGALPVQLPLLAPEDAPVCIQALDGLLLPGGGDLDPALYGQETLTYLRSFCPELDAFEMALTRSALEADLPLLAVCRGVQVLNVARGGTLWQDLPSQRPESTRHECRVKTERSHFIEVVPGSRLASILGEGTHAVNTRHHQAPRDVGQGLAVSAHCLEDGLIEALESPEHRFCLGVQFHPEDLPDQFRGLFEAFVDQARAYQEKRDKGVRRPPIHA